MTGRAPIRLPWDYVGPPQPGAPVRLNLPTPEGAELGSHMARFADLEAAKLEAARKPVPKRCNDCAFRAGTMPNACASTLMNATKCIFEREPFHCHQGIGDDGEPTRICAGYLLLTEAADG